MKITNTDLNAIRAVLAKSKTLREVAEEYDVRQSALVAVTILLATTRRSFARGEYGKVLRALVAAPGFPGANQPDNESLPSSYASKLSDGLVTASRKLNLHTSARRGGRITLNPLRELQELLGEDPQYGPVARELYEIYRPTSRRTQPATPTRGANEALQRQLHAILTATTEIETIAADLRDTTVRLLAKHFPEE